MNKEAFLYVWTDHLTNMLYVGVHKGTPTDGYICSQPHMKSVYYKRHTDFTRQIIAYGSFKEVRKLEESILTSVNAPCNKEYYNNSFGNGTFKCRSDIDVRERYFKKHGVEYPSQHKDYIKKRKQTSKIKYGVDDFTKSKDVLDRKKLTVLSRYGTEYNFQSDIIKDKIKETNLQRHGVEYPMQSEVIRAKSVQTNLEQYGVENVSQVPEILERKRETWLENYGVSHPFKSEKVKKKLVSGRLKKYGVTNPMKNKELQQKNQQAQKDTQSKVVNLPYDEFLHYIDSRMNLYNVKGGRNGRITRLINLRNLNEDDVYKDLETITV